jgi:hypothetical protein
VDDASWLPDQAASAFVAENQLRGRMLVFFNWGEYVLWHFGSTIKVSIDGRRETIYSDRHITGHLEAYRGTPAGLAYVRELSPDYVWLPKAAPGAARLQSEGWKTIFAGDRSIVLARDGASPDNRAWTMPASGCFPGRLGKPSPLASGFWKDV